MRSQLSADDRAGHARSWLATLGCRALCVLAALGAPLAASSVAQAPPADLLRSPWTFTDADSTVHEWGDMNGDGHVDRIYPDHIFVDLLAVVLGDGLGGDGPTVTSPITVGDLGRIALGDVNGDGRSDVAYTDFEQPVVRVVLGASDGTVATSATLTLPLGTSTFGAALCDVTGDGDLDVVVTQFQVNRISVFVGNGDGSFVTPPVQSVSAFLLNQEIKSGDVDGDGNLDLLIHSGAFAIVKSGLLFGHGDGSFDPMIVLDDLYFGDIGDLDGDGRDDIALRYADNQHFYLAWNPEDGLTDVPFEVESPASFLNFAAIADVDRDGANELLAGFSPDVLDVFRHVGGGELAFAGRFGLDVTGGSLALADIDEDGGVDLLCTASHKIGRHWGRGDGTFESVYGFGEWVRDTAVADVTGDGLPDVVSVFGDELPAQLMRGRLDGGLDAPEVIDAGPAPHQVWLLDATGDGVLDVLASGGTSVAVAAGHDDGSFDPPLLASLPQAIVQTVVAPFGGDGLPDVAVLLADPGDDTGRLVHVLENVRGQMVHVASQQLAPPGTHVIAFQPADVDSDGDTDLLSQWFGGEWFTGFLRVYVKTPQGFSPGLVFELNAGEFTAQDLDLDGDIDLAMAGGENNKVVILLGDGAGGFSAPTFLTSNYVLRPPVAHDLDGDGLLDLIQPAIGAGQLSDGQIKVALGQGGGAFGPFGGWDLGGRPSVVRAADMNSDGQPDLVIGHESGLLAIVEHGQQPWSKLGHSLAGRAGWSRLEGFGPLTPGSSVTLRASNGPPFAPAILIAGPAVISVPFKGGVLVPLPVLVQPLGLLDAEGTLQISGTWPADMPPNASFAMQVWRPEAGAPVGFAATTAIRGTTP